MEFHDKYSHIGYSFPSVPKTWLPFVERAIKNIERAMWPWWIPMFIKRWIHYQATGGSIVMIRNRFWHNVRQLLTNNQLITDIKEKYADLRIYGYYGDKIEKIIEQAEKDCASTCESCGAYSKDVDVSVVFGWYRRFCKECRRKTLSDV